VFGLGSRDAHVRLTPKPPPGEIAPPAPAGGEGAAAPQEIAPPIQAQEAPEEARFPERPELVPPGKVEQAEAAPDLGGLGEVARAVLLELLSLMGVDDAQVDVRRSEPADGDTYSPLMLDVNVRGDALIGPRGETLNALQYITRLIVGREQGGRVRLVLDVNGYKVRREQKVRQLAERLARQAVDTDRTVVLEPMPPFERRIVHLALRDDPEVTTQSVGEGDRRKVTIIPRYE
jgi:spoIIIJ-associated protein